MTPFRHLLPGLLLTLCCLEAARAEVPYVNWENHPVHPLAISPDGTLMAVAHTADNRVQFFDVSGGLPAPAGSVPVGLEPVSVRFRTQGELWVVNHLSDSVSVVDVPGRRVVRNLATADEPYDVVFAGAAGRAFVSASQANRVQVFDPADPGAAPIDVEIGAEDPRALAVSPDGETVYAAIFESGNGSTILAGETAIGNDPPNVALQSDTPYGGQNPPPNMGGGFAPPITEGLPDAPPSSHIVRKDSAGRWMDDNGRDWTRWVSGDRAQDSGRVPGWDLPDRDVAIIDAETLAVSYATRLATMGMALAVNPASGAVTLVGTDAQNEVRFEPNVNGVFLRVQVGIVDPADAQQKSVVDLNPHLDYTVRTLPQAERDLSLGDPRGIAWLASGERGYVAGMGSNNVVAIDPDGARSEGIAPIEVGEGPTGLALNEAAGLLYAWNHFEATISVVDLESHAETARVPVFSPVPQAIRDGRPFLYDTHRTSGLGHVSCASCHVDARMDRLAWDLGVPDGEMTPFTGNCNTDRVGPFCQEFHPMKGPMLTQTLQDIIGHEPFHWSGDRAGLEAFNGAFVSLQGDDAVLTADEMQRFENFLDTVTFPPNPYRNLDNSLARDIPLPGIVSPGNSFKFSEEGTPLPNGDAWAGMNQFISGRLSLLPGVPADDQNCTLCHSLPTGMAPNSTNRDPFANLILGGATLPPGPNGENHLLISSGGTLTGRTMKVPQLRNLYERTGFDVTSTESTGGFGYTHDGAVDSLARFAGLEEFGVANDQALADMTAFLLSFSGSDLPTDNPSFTRELPSQDTHAAVGQQVTLADGAPSERYEALLALAQDGAVDLVAHHRDGLRTRGWAYDAGSGAFVADDASAPASPAALVAAATGGRETTFTAVPKGLGTRLGNDRDGDGVKDGEEIRLGSNPADPASNTLTPAAGMWYNPARSGSGIDLQAGGPNMAATWFTYNEDGTPHWYQAAGAYADGTWTGDLLQFTWNPATQRADFEVVGTLTMTFTDRYNATFAWTIGDEQGSEAYIRGLFDTSFTRDIYTAQWYDPNQPGWGIAVDALGGQRAQILYYYDGDNRPRWMLAPSANAAENVVTLQTFLGACPWCAYEPSTAEDAGTIRFDFESNRAGRVVIDVGYPGTPGARFQRDVAIVAGTREVIDPLAQ